MLRPGSSSADPPAVPLPGRPAAASAWRLRLLGDVQLTHPGGAARPLPGRAAAALLACLALASDQARTRESLIDLLWPDATLAVGRNRLRQLLSSLKAALGQTPAEPALLLTDRLHLRLAPQALWCDVVAFEQAWRSGRSTEARALYRGELMPGHADGWIHEERLRLAALAERLGETAPDGPGGPPTADPAASVDDTPASLPLPAYLTRLHGAQAQVAGLLAQVRAHRLVTVLGPGGHGKTRLAVEVARTLAVEPAPRRFDLLAFVPLVGCAGGPGAVDAVQAALLLALQGDGGAAQPAQALRRRLAGRQALLVLDNAEQLVDDIGPWLADLLAQAPGLHLLVTSRRLLGLDGERQHLLPALPLPAPGAPGAEAGDIDANPAVALFVDRARAARPGFPTDPDTLGAVAALVQQLQGMPLAIELAASHMGSLSPQALLSLLQQGAGDGTGLRLLARGGPRGAADPRHASMLAVVRWSWQLLPPVARQLLPRLSVVAGSFSLDAAVALASAPAVDVVLALQALVAHSMLRAEPGRDRFAMFELIREFAAAELPPPEAQALRQRHRQWLTRWFAGLPLSTPLQQVRPELPNLAAAMVQAEADGADADAARLAQAAQPALSAITLPAPALAALQRCADRLPAGALQAVTWASLARTCLLAGQSALALQLTDQALASLPAADAPAAGDGPLATPGLARALVLTRLAHVRWRLQRDPRAGAWLAEALALASAAGALPLQATILTNQGALLRVADPAASIALQRRAVALWAAAGDAHGVNVGRCNLALALLARRSGAAEAVALAGQAMRDTRAQGDEMQHALACNLSGEAWSRLGQWALAASAYRACIRSAFAAAEPWPLAYGLWNLPRALAHLRQPRLAAQLMGFAQQHAPAVSGPLQGADQHDLRRLRRLCQLQLGAPATQSAWQQGEGLALADAVRLALGPVDAVDTAAAAGQADATGQRQPA